MSFLIIKRDPPLPPLLTSIVNSSTPKNLGKEADRPPCCAEESVEFYQLVKDSGLTVQRVREDFVGTCLDAGSVEVAPLSKDKSGVICLTR